MATDMAAWLFDDGATVADALSPLVDLSQTALAIAPFHRCAPPIRLIFLDRTQCDAGRRRAMLPLRFFITREQAIWEILFV
jgi:hypothetical protein